MSLARLASLVSVTAVIGVACGGGGLAPTGSEDQITPPTFEAEPTPCAIDPVAPSPPAVVGSGLDWVFGDDLPATFPEPVLDRSSIVPVLPPDTIPAVDDPNCVPANAVDFLADDAAVIVVEVNGDARAYPVEIMTWHELVNDTIGGEPIAVSYCPLCNSAIAYERRLGDQVLDFGTSGALSQSSLVMYDRQSETLWTHFDGRAVVGELAGEKLEFVPAAVVSWESFREQFPEGLVLSRDTGFERSYGLNPYPGYDSADDPIAAFITGDIDPRMEAKARVVGVESDGEAIAVDRSRLFSRGVVTFALAGQELTAWNLPGTASALDERTVDGGDDVGAVGVFVPRIEGRQLSFDRLSEGFVDRETGSTWSILGVAVDGPLAGAQLERVPHVDTFWFAWGSFHEQTAIADP